MRKYKDLTGQRFGKLVVIEHDDTNNVNSWLCQCDCGNFKSVRATNLKTGNTKSCGCFWGDDYQTRLLESGLYYSETLKKVLNRHIGYVHAPVEKNFL